MAAQDLIRIGREFINAYNRNDREGLKGMLAADIGYDEVSSQRKIKGTDACLEAWEGWRKAFPDIRGTITRTCVGGNTVTQEVTWEGTHNGVLVTPWGTFPPSGKRQTTRAAQFLTFEGDRIKECHHYFDMLTLFQQIGVMPQKLPGSAAAAD